MASRGFNPLRMGLPALLALRLGRELIEVELMVPGLRGVVVDGAVGRHDDVFQRLVGIGRIDDQLVEFVDIADVMFVVVVVQRLLGELRRQRIVGIGKLLGHEARSGGGIGLHKREN